MLMLSLFWYGVLFRGNRIRVLITSALALLSGAAFGVAPFDPTLAKRFDQAVEWEIQIGTRPMQALELADSAIQALEPWADFVMLDSASPQKWLAMRTKAHLHMVRWFVTQSAIDDRIARELYSELDKPMPPSLPVSGFGTRMLAADYQSLARLAAARGEGRQREEGMLRAALAIHRNSKGADNTNFVQRDLVMFELWRVTDGDRTVLDEWLRFVDAEPEQARERSTYVLAGPLVASGQIEETFTRLERIVSTRPEIDRKDKTRAQERDHMCMFIRLEDWTEKLRAANAARTDRLVAALCP